MTTNKEFYGTDTPSCITYMEFGEINHQTSEKNIWGFKLHQKAYDWFMLARYANDILAVRKMRNLIKENKSKECIDLFWQEIHHKDELCIGLGKLAALYSTGKSDASFFELGQTLFGCIDSMEFGQEIMPTDYKLNLKNVHWLGVDISEMFNELAKVFYNEYKIDTALNKKDLQPKWDVFYSKGITLLYAIREMSEFYEFLTSSECAYFDYSFSLGEVQDRTIGSGKNVRYLALNDFLNTYQEVLKNKKVLVNTKTSRKIEKTNQIWIEFFVGSEDKVKKFLDYENTVSKSLGAFKGSDIFVDEYHTSWISIEDYIKTI